MTCYSPQLPNTTIDADKNSAGKQFRYYFEMDNIIINMTGEDPLDVFTIFADPIFKAFPGSKEKALKKADYLTINVSFFNVKTVILQTFLFIGTPLWFENAFATLLVRKFISFEV